MNLESPGFDFRPGLGHRERVEESPGPGTLDVLAPHQIAAAVGRLAGLLGELDADREGKRRGLQLLLIGRQLYQLYVSTVVPKDWAPLTRLTHGAFAAARGQLNPASYQWGEATYWLGLITAEIARWAQHRPTAERAAGLIQEAASHAALVPLRRLSLLDTTAAERDVQELLEELTESGDLEDRERAAGLAVGSLDFSELRGWLEAHGHRVPEPEGGESTWEGFREWLRRALAALVAPPGPQPVFQPGIGDTPEGPVSCDLFEPSPAGPQPLNDLRVDIVSAVVDRTGYLEIGLRAVGALASYRGRTVGTEPALPGAEPTRLRRSRFQLRAHLPPGALPAEVRAGPAGRKPLPAAFIAEHFRFVVGPAAAESA